jgi:hypothetical protein
MNGQSEMLRKRNQKPSFLDEYNRKDVFNAADWVIQHKYPGQNILQR